MTSQGLVSLLEILRFYADVFVKVTSHIGTAVEQLGKDGYDLWQDDEMMTLLESDLSGLQKMCEENELPVTKVMVDSLSVAFSFRDSTVAPDALKVLAQKRQPSGLWRIELIALLKRLEDELSTKVYLQIPYSRKQRFDDPLNGWIEVALNFPDAIGDIEEMQKCFALSRYRASMFHAMHVAEWCAIELGDHIGVSDPMKGWGPTTKRLGDLVRDGRSRFPNSLKVSFEFVEQMNQEVATMKMAWRHKIDHAANTLIILPNADFTPDIAEHIIQSVKVFMERVWEGIK